MTVASAPPPAAERPGLSQAVSLGVIAGIAQARIDSVLHARGINLRKYGAIRHIIATPGISFSELARRFDITVQSMHTLAASLIEAGLLESSISSPGDPAELTVTPAGRALSAELAQDLATVDVELFGAEASPEWQRLGAAVSAVVRAELPAPGS